MKKIDILQLIASVFLLIGTVINILNFYIEIHFAVLICLGPIYLTSIILYAIVLVKKIRLKKNNTE